MRSFQRLYSSRPVLVFIIDTVLIVMFAVIGRASHGEDVGILGVAITAYPFLIGMLAGWLVSALLRPRMALLFPAGLIIWVCTVVIGMIVRVITAQNSQPGFAQLVPFLIVASVVLAIFLLVPRALFGRARFRAQQPHEELASSKTSEASAHDENAAQPHATAHITAAEALRRRNAGRDS